MLNIIRIITGYLEENCYIVHNKKECLIVDPGDNLDKILNTINDLNLKVDAILITHYHFDHIGCLNDLCIMYPNVVVVDYKNKNENIMKKYCFSVIENYGHTMDSCSFYFEKYNFLFSGDFIFKETIGNYDINNKKYMKESLNKLKDLPLNTIIYPGHGENTTLNYELKNNIYLIGDLW